MRTSWIVAASMLCSGVALADPLQMPLVKNGNGLPQGATGAVCIRMDGTACPADSKGNPAVSDSSNASYSTALEQSSLASYTFGASNVAAARRWWANCPVSTTATVTLTLAGGGTRPVTLYDGPYSDAERISGFSGNSGCTIGIEG